MGLKIGDIFVSCVNDHRNYSDDEITFRDMIFAQELLNRCETIANLARKSKKEAPSMLVTRLVDPELDQAVRNILTQSDK